MAHNLGIKHDCVNQACSAPSYTGPRPSRYGGQYSGKAYCYGYMDYDLCVVNGVPNFNCKTNSWSECSVYDFAHYANKQHSYCLQPKNAQSTSGIHYR